MTDPTKPPYKTTHTSADPSAVDRTGVTEPAVTPAAIAVSVGGVLVAIAGFALAQPLDLELLGIIVAISGAVMAIIGVLLARGGQRTGLVLPVLCAVVASIIAIALLVGGVAEAEGVDSPEEASEELNEALTAPSDEPVDLDDDVNGLEAGDIENNPDPDDDATDAPIVDPEMDPR